MNTTQTLLILLTFFLITAHSCDSHSKEKNTCRRMLGIEKCLPNVGECQDDKTCVLREEITKGGWIIQYISHKNTTWCRKAIVWKLIEDPQWGKYYESHSTTPNCKANFLTDIMK